MSTLQDIDPECSNDTGCEPVEQIIVPRSGDIGNFEVHRALPSRERRTVGPFIFWDQVGPGEFLTNQGVDVRPHPHIGLSTVTYLFSGTLDHKDSLGYAQRIVPGDVNIMTAGSGITHSERTGQDIRQKPSELFGIQSWLALPLKNEEDDADFKHIDQSQLPRIEETGFKARIIMGEYAGKTSPVVTHADTLYVDITLNEGQKIEIPNTTEERALYPLNGKIEVGGTPYDAMQLLILRPGDLVTVKALQDVRIMLMGGEALDGPRHIWWNFVSSRKDRIEQAKEDWQMGRFPDVADDEEFIPLPDH